MNMKIIRPQYKIGDIVVLAQRGQDSTIYEQHEIVFAYRYEEDDFWYYDFKAFEGSRAESDLQYKI